MWTKTIKKMRITNSLLSSIFFKCSCSILLCTVLSCAEKKSKEQEAVVSYNHKSPANERKTDEIVAINYSCDNLSSRFSSYEQAVNAVKRSSFRFQDYRNMSSSGFIDYGKYYSCDNYKGFLILSLNRREYIYRSVPIQVWQNFKNANSFGNFYNYYIRKNANYRL